MLFIKQKTKVCHHLKMICCTTIVVTWVDAQVDYLQFCIIFIVKSILMEVNGFVDYGLSFFKISSQPEFIFR